MDEEREDMDLFAAIKGFLRDPQESARKAWFWLREPHERWERPRIQVLYFVTLALTTLFALAYSWPTGDYTWMLIPAGIATVGILANVLGWARSKRDRTMAFRPPRKKSTIRLLKWLVSLALYFIWTLVQKGLALGNHFWESVGRRIKN
ncbi:MAG: hypothetical protein Q8N84_03825 [bacterium]|nr:hypothetical protein [bacterium]